jgi:RsiW-degrading membrane proteinase PrsW (M82 family)
VVAITMLEYPFQSDGLSNAVAGPIEEVAKLAVPFALYLLSARFRAPRAGVALVLASAATLGVFEAAGYAWHLPGSTATTAMASTVVWRPLWDAPVHMVLTGTIAAVLWRRWHSHGGLHIDLPMAVTVIGVMALHSVIDWSSDLRGSLSSLSLLGLVLAYMWFKMAVRQLAPPDAVAGNPPWWRPWRLPTATAAPQGSTRTSQPTDTRPGRRTAA